MKLVICLVLVLSLSPVGLIGQIVVSYQYNIDQLIQIPFEDIAGIEYTPNSITIDGSNELFDLV